MGFSAATVTTISNASVCYTSDTQTQTHLSVVYLPSFAFQTLHKVHTKNFRMARDLKAGKWKLPPAAVGNDDDNTDDYGYFVATLQAKDTRRISTLGTLMQVVSPNEKYTPEG